MCPWNLLNTSELYSSPHGIECALQQPYFRCGRISKMKKILIVYHDAGGGHRNAAVALETVIAQQPRDWRVRLGNVQEDTEPPETYPTHPPNPALLCKKQQGHYHAVT